MLPISTPACGEERWSVKTMADADADKISPRPLPAKVADLVGVEAPPRSVLDLHKNARLPVELHNYRVQGYLVGFKLETDQDFHIVIADLDNPKLTMIVEMPDPACVPVELRPTTALLRDHWEERFGKATAKFKNVLQRHIKVEFIGPGFFDFIHGQTGVAKNGFEIHPVRMWKEVFAPPAEVGEART